MTSVGAVVALAVIWVLLWGAASPANVLSGLLIGTLLVLVVPGLRRRRGAPRARLRPIAIARLVGFMLVTTVRSNVELTRDVLSPASRRRTAIVGVQLPGCSDEVLTLISNLLALSPGTMPIEIRWEDPVVLYVHVLRLTDIEDVRREILHLTDLTVKAFGSDQAIAEQAEYMARRE
jgi:multicomponent Na+:H+ antiporter subunit E